MSPQLRADLLKRYLTLNELAEAIDRHPRTVLRWTKLPSGALPYTTMGKQKLTTQQWWDEWLMNRRKVLNPDRRRRKR
jgi:hypothetical protein